MRERGLKSVVEMWDMSEGEVAPRAGAWIEIPEPDGETAYIVVAPRAGAWIEITQAVPGVRNGKSLPVRERGLK